MSKGKYSTFLDESGLCSLQSRAHSLLQKQWRSNWNQSFCPHSVQGQICCFDESTLSLQHSSSSSVAIDHIWIDGGWLTPSINLYFQAKFKLIFGFQHGHKVLKQKHSVQWGAVYGFPWQFSVVIKRCFQIEKQKMMLLRLPSTASPILNWQLLNVSFEASRWLHRMTVVVCHLRVSAFDLYFTKANEGCHRFCMCIRGGLGVGGWILIQHTAMQ